MRYRLRTLMILMAVLPPLLAAIWFAPGVAAVMLGFLVFAACLVAVSVGLTIGLTVIAEAFISSWERRK